MPVLFGLGIAAYFSLAVEPPLWAGPLGLGAALSGVFVSMRLQKISGLVLAMVLAIVAAGFSAAQIRTISVQAPVLTARIGPTAVSGRIAAVESFPKASRVTLEKPRIAGLRPDLVPEKIRVKLKGAQPVMQAGDWIRVRAILSPPSPPAAPGAFDFQRQSYFRGLGGFGFSLGQAEIIAKAEADENAFASFHLGLAKIRQDIGARVRGKLGGRAGAVAAALMTGERSAIPEDVLKSMRDSGLAHLLAISGLHIGLVATILFIGFRGLMALSSPLALRYPIKKWAAAIAIAGALAYALIAGATVPTQRAFLMVGLVLIAVMVDRRGISVRLVAWAALVILILQPESLLGASFQMSFAAVTALIATYEVIAERRRLKDHDGGTLPPWLRKAGFYLGGVALTTLVAGSATGPFAVYHFNRFADYGLAANLVAVPVTALWVMPCAVAAFLLMPFGLEGLALTPMGQGVEIVIRVAETVAAWPGAVTLVPAMPPWALAAIALGGLWLCLWRGRWRAWGLAGIACGMVAMAFVTPPDILIDAKGRLLAVQTAEEAGGAVAFSTLRRARFDREIWLRRLGRETPGAIWPKTGLGPKAGLARQLSCDLEGCLFRASGQVVALAYGEGALAEDCWAADIVIATVPVRRNCPAATLVDRFDLWRHGAHAIWLDPSGIRIETVNGVRGDRPWVIKAKSRKPRSGKI
ncbi:MAG: ComEC/Rec2 family competence protein [Rhodospirillales bacterium]|nr:ComEC/Rec2 family competence protein [Rhodospirillales bacterium]